MHSRQERETSETTAAETRTAYAKACALLGYSGPDHEADEVIDLVGVTDDGRRAARLAAFYPAPITEAIDRAARLARLHPEALLDAGHLPLLDLLA
ncbi:MAG: hypothetical protein IPI67_01930, partial [Myxococcales bacterium]|nr:hypothetical protein [Myxococcales bacterium]